MDLSSITLKDLSYLSALAETAHFGRAAQMCHVTQPALSTQIKKIEDLLEVQIFERTNRSVQLTEVGKEIVEQARLILEQAQLLAEIAKRNKSVLTGRFRLGLIHTIGPYLVPHFIHDIKKQYPHLDLVIIEGMTEDLLKKLDENKLDAIVLSNNVDLANYASFSLFFEPFVLMVSKENTLSQKKDVTVKDLDLEKMIFLEKGNCLSDDVQNVCKFKTQKKSALASATSIETLRYLVSYLNSYTLIPQLSIAHSSIIDNLVGYQFFAHKNVGREVILVARKTYPNGKNIKALRDFLRGVGQRVFSAPVRDSSAPARGGRF